MRRAGTVSYSSDAGNDDDDAQLITHFAAYFFRSVEGGELFDRVIDDNFVLTERACAVFVRQVCQAMEFVHRNNIIHLDLKPENILCLTRDGNRIKIIDFGLARKFDPEKKLQVRVFSGTLFISFGLSRCACGVRCMRCVQISTVSKHPICQCGVRL